MKRLIKKAEESIKTLKELEQKVMALETNDYQGVMPEGFFELKKIRKDKPYCITVFPICDGTVTLRADFANVPSTAVAKTWFDNFLKSNGLTQYMQQIDVDIVDQEDFMKTRVSTELGINN